MNSINIIWFCDPWYGFLVRDKSNGTWNINQQPSNCPENKIMVWQFKYIIRFNSNNLTRQTLLISLIYRESYTDSWHDAMFTLLVNVLHLHAVIYWAAFCTDCSEILNSNVVFSEIVFYCCFDWIISFTFRSSIFLKWSKAKMNVTTRTVKYSFFLWI